MIQFVRDPKGKMMKRWVGVNVAMALFLLGTLSALHVIVPSSTQECFSVEAEQHKHGISLNYEVIRGVADLLETELSDGKDAVIFSNIGPSGRFVAPIENGGVHTVCFKASAGDIIVGFSMHADDPAHEVLSNADAAKIKHVQELEDLVYELSTTLDTVKDTQAYMKAIKTYHNQVITSTHSRIMWWSCVEAVVLGIVSISQIVYLRRTLEVRRLL